MSNNARIILPFHVRNSRMMDVVGKVVGTPYRIRSLGQPSRILNEKDLPPCSEGASWAIIFPSMPEFGMHVPDNCGDMSHAQLCFEDMAGNRHAWFFHAEREEEDGCLLHPGAHALAGAVGLRLVEFFGGTLQRHDDDEPGYTVDPLTAKFPPKRPGQSSDDRFYQFYNLLLAEPLLHSDELRAAAEKSPRGLRDEEISLIEKLDLANAAVEIEQATPLAPLPSRTHRI